ncbi:hypothetical protein [Haloactinomyces albus]|uniref:Uncharacterized protein n=1 Tax=Haloactinomyces albus TaxID=1352928 RepID=A0AAE3ZEK9_9ACTN|nr:hypothetical protein [Haloactinomyces albus]MDR7302460.1 hypothetical protein [Haloactinomyces albus]
MGGSAEESGSSSQLGISDKNEPSSLDHENPEQHLDSSSDEDKFGNQQLSKIADEDLEKFQGELVDVLDGSYEEPSEIPVDSLGSSGGSDDVPGAALAAGDEPYSAPECFADPNFRASRADAINMMHNYREGEWEKGAKDFESIGDSSPELAAVDLEVAMGARAYTSWHSYADIDRALRDKPKVLTTSRPSKIVDVLVGNL